MGKDTSGNYGYRVKGTEYVGMGKRIDDLLYEGNYSAADVAEKIGINRITLRYVMENNDGKVSTISKIANFFGVSLDWLVSGIGERA